MKRNTGKCAGLWVVGWDPGLVEGSAACYVPGVRAYSLCVLALLPLQWACGGPATSAAPAAPEPKVQRPISRPMEAKPTDVPDEDVLFGLQSELGAMRSCLRQPGALQLRWMVDKQGNSSAFEVAWSTLHDEEAVSCLTALIEDRHFELPPNTSMGRAEWTFVKALPREERASSKGRRRSKSRREGGVKFEPAGGLGESEVDDVVQSGMRLYAHCLREGVLTDSSISGRLALSWNVDQQGRASEMADAGSDLGDQRVVDCAAECFYALQYPKPSTAPVRVTYSLLFNED